MQLLQSVVQSLQWTYSFFWQLCPEQGVLVWADGYYNGNVRIRKMVQPAEMSGEEAFLQRSQQLRQLYESLSVAETKVPSVHQPSIELSPGDLTETEWFYLVCMSFAFPPGCGLPGKAYEQQQPVWLSRASEADRKDFPRVLLAKSAGLETIICVPFTNGVLELGTIEKVEEDRALIDHATSFFVMSQAHSHDSIHDSHETPISALYSSDPTLLARGQRLFRLPPLSTMHSPPDVEEELLSDEVVQSSCFESDMGTAENSSAGTVDVTHPCDMSTVESTTADQVEPNEPADQQIKEIPEELLLSSKKRKPTGSSHSSCLQKLAIRSMTSHSCQSQKASEFENDNTGINSQSPGVRTIEHMSQDNSHYSSTVSTILQCNIVPDLGFIFDNLQRQPQRSAFDNWTCQRDCSTLPMQHVGSPQGLLKNVLCTIPHLYRWFEDQNLLVHKNIEEGAAKCYNSTPQEDPSVNHVLAERKRREKLNEKFLILQSLVPLTKVDKVSILAGTIAYIKHLLRRVQDCEARIKLMQQGKKGKQAFGHTLGNSKSIKSIPTGRSFLVLDVAQHHISN